MRPERFTAKLQTALSDAQSLALGQDHSSIESLHLLIALLQQGDATLMGLLARAGADTRQALTLARQQLADLPRLTTATGEIGAGQDLMRVLNLADRQAQQRKDSVITTELAVLAMLEGNSQAGQVLRKAGALPENLKR